MLLNLYDDDFENCDETVRVSVAVPVPDDF